MDEIPVLTIAIPSYRITICHKPSEETTYLRWGHPIPKIYEDNKPDLEKVSEQLVQLLRNHFNHERIGLRLLSSSEHEHKSTKDLIEMIMELGHDRYDPNRKGDRYENIDKLPIDIFALALKVGDEKKEACIKHALESFYYYPLINNRTPKRVDLGIIYNLEHLKPVVHRYKGREQELKTDGYVFKNPHNKRASVKGIIEIL